MKLRILVDLDECVFDFIGQFIKVYKEKTGKELYMHDFTEWNLVELFGEVSLDCFSNSEFFENLLPFRGAVESLKRMNENYELFIATNAMNNSKIVEGKMKSIKRHLPFIDENNIFFTGRKYDISADIMIDDCPEYLQKFELFTIAMDRPYNKKIYTHFRILNNDWNAIEEYCAKIKKIINSYEFNLRKYDYNKNKSVH